MAQVQPPAPAGDLAAEYRQAQSAAVVFDQSDRGKVEVSEADAQRFLHNLTSNDILHLAPGAGCEAFLLTQKARVVAYLTIFHLPNPSGKSSFWLDFAPNTTGKAVAHLDHFLISERVAFTDHTSDLTQFHVAGPQAAEVLAKVFAALAAPDDLHATSTTFHSLVCQVRRHDRLGVPGFDVLAPAAGAKQLWDSLTAAGARPAGREAYEVLRIAAGTPAQGNDVDETTFAPEVDRAGRAISYTKGCYLGQESVVMARDRGQVNRFLRRLTLPDGPVPAGSLLFRDGKEVGRVTSSTCLPGAGGVGLGYVRRGSQEPGTALEVEVSGQRHPCLVSR
jgi:folate-binding protein YgfZ